MIIDFFSRGAMTHGRISKRHPVVANHFGIVMIHKYNFSEPVCNLTKTFFAPGQTGKITVAFNCTIYNMFVYSVSHQPYPLIN